jgi:hypothetical protein
MSIHPAFAQTVEIDGNTFSIDSGARWQCVEGQDWTQVSLIGCKDARLNNLTICWDWSQGSVRPAKKAERVAHIIRDADLIASHIEGRLA